MTNCMYRHFFPDFAVSLQCLQTETCYRLDTAGPVSVWYAKRAVTSARRNIITSELKYPLEFLMKSEKEPAAFYSTL